MSTYCAVLIVFLFHNVEVFSSMQNVIRCSRRFTPGYCEEDVKPVWTFVFQRQGCVMRLGCPPSVRVNRFHKQTQCTRRCKVLVDLYTQILLNDTIAYVQGSSRRDIDGKPYLRTDTMDAVEPKVYEDYARDVPHYDTDDNDSFGDIVPGNIDGDTEAHSFLDGLNK